MLLDAVDAEGPHDEPEFEGPEAAAQRDLPVLKQAHWWGYSDILAKGWEPDSRERRSPGGRA